MVRVFLIAMAVVPMCASYAGAAEASSSRQPLKVITYNVQFLPGAASIVNARKDPQYRARTLGHRLAAYDIICLNEVFHLQHREILFSELRKTIGEGCQMVVSPQPADGRFNGGLAIVSRLPFVETHDLTYSVGSSPKQYGILADGFAAKGALHARIDCSTGSTSKRCVDVFVTHLDSRDQQVRKTQYAELADFVKAHGDRSNPTLIMGDMNTGGMSGDRKNPRSLYNIMIATYAAARPGLPLVDLWPSLNEGEGGTSAPDNPKGGHRIDYMFLSNPKGPWQLKPLSAKVNPFPDAKVGTLSDHSAVEAEFACPRR